MITQITQSNNEKYNLLFAKLATKLGLSNPITTLEEYYSHLTEIYALDDKWEYLAIPVDEEVFHINTNTREIAVPYFFQNNGIGVQGDALAETIFFTVDRFFDTADLLSKQIAIEWSIAGQKGLSEALFVHTVENNNIKFGWTFSKELMNSSGNLTFSVRFYTLSDGEIEYCLRTKTASVKIQPSLSIKFDENNTLISENVIIEELQKLMSATTDRNKFLTPPTLDLLNNKGYINASRFMKDSNTNTASRPGYKGYYDTDTELLAYGYPSDNFKDESFSWFRLDGNSYVRVNEDCCSVEYRTAAELNDFNPKGLWYEENSFDVNGDPQFKRRSEALSSINDTNKNSLYRKIGVLTFDEEKAPKYDTYRVILGNTQIEEDTMKLESNYLLNPIVTFFAIGPRAITSVTRETNAELISKGFVPINAGVVEKIALAKTKVESEIIPKITFKEDFSSFDYNTYPLLKDFNIDDLNEDAAKYEKVVVSWEKETEDGWVDYADEIFTEDGTYRATIKSTRNESTVQSLPYTCIIRYKPEMPDFIIDSTVSGRKVRFGLDVVGDIDSTRIKEFKIQGAIKEVDDTIIPINTVISADSWYFIGEFDNGAEIEITAAAINDIDDISEPIGPTNAQGE